MIERSLKLPLEGSQSIFLFGPRGVGKSYWLSRQLPGALYIDLLDSQIRFDLEVDLSRLRRYLSQDLNQWIVIDEIQKLPELLDEVHKLIEQDSRKFVLTGSSARKLKREGVNLLAGRALTYKLFPLTAIELGCQFDLAHSLEFGHMPSIYDKLDLNKTDYLNSYIKTYLKEEVMQEGLARDLAAFSRFLEAASFSQGSTLNISAIARDASVKANTVAGYFDLIEDMLVSYRLPVFTKRAKRRLVAHPKFYFFDAGIYYHLRPKSILDSVSELHGAGLETLVLQDLLAVNEYNKLGYQIFYWRTTNGTEVDFVVLGAKKLLAIEVKHSSKFHPKDFTGLKAFKKDYPEAELMLLYLGSAKQEYQGIQVIPVQEFLPGLLRYL
ncbi:MAG: ATP-binding protein [Cyanobacteria bacterium]|nr:ATP-binding protein [Cyanobacteriota bacterium]